MGFFTPRPRTDSPASVLPEDFWDIDFVVVRAEIDYRSSVSMGEKLEVEIHVSRMGASSFDFSYRVSRPDGSLVAEAKTTQVAFDWKSRTKKPLSEERRRQIEAFERASQ